MKTIIFQGDSITDFGRDKNCRIPNCPGGFGTGYANLTAAKLLADFPQEQLQCYNMGISGNRIVDLYARWKADTLNFKPDLISILIGVNDVWHERDFQNGIELDRYETLYRMLLEWTMKTLPQTKIVLCQPFTLPCGVIDQKFADDVKDYAEVVLKLSKELNLTFVPFQEMFQKALQQGFAPESLAGDGVHPAMAGHELMSRFWIDCVVRQAHLI